MRTAVVNFVGADAKEKVAELHNVESITWKDRVIEIFYDGGNSLIVDRNRVSHVHTSDKEEEEAQEEKADVNPKPKSKRKTPAAKGKG